jgi:hypothetical protein
MKRRLTSLTTIILTAVVMAAMLLASVRTVANSEPGHNSFMPDPDGFGFRNYGNDHPEGNLSIADVYGLFGEQVCTSVTNGVCTPTPDAQLWIDTMNGYMVSGHCEGFTVLAYRFFNNELAQATFTPGAATTFALNQGTQLMHEIALNFTYQVFDEVWKAVVDGPPSQVVASLKKLNQPVNLGIFSKSGGGHSVLAYTVQDKGNNIVWIQIYDNNNPGEDAYIEVDTKADTWKYMPPDLAPNGDGADWQGDKNSDSLIYTPFSVYDLPAKCPFCPGGGGRADSGSSVGLAIARQAIATAYYQNVTVNGTGVDLEITNSLGQRIGRRFGQLINEIADAHMIRLRSGLYSQDLYFMVPGGQDYTFTAQTNGTSTIQNVDVRSFGGGTYFSVDGLNISPNQQEQITLSNNGQTISYTPGGEQDPTIKLAFTVGEVTYLVVVGNIDMQSGSQLSVGFDPLTQQLNLSVNGVQDPTISLAFARIEGNNIQIFSADDLQISPNGSALADLLNWNGQSNFPLSVDANGDGTYEGTASLQDLPLSELIEAGQTSAEIISHLAEFAPYMNDIENSDFTEKLLTLGLSGSELGQVFFAFNMFGMSLDELAQYLLKLGNMFDVAQFLAELHLSDEDLQTLISLLPADWQTYLSAQLAMIEMTWEAYSMA